MKTAITQQRYRATSVRPMSSWFTLMFRCKAESMMTGNADAYFSAFARCWPPHPPAPVPPDRRFEARTRRYSIMHWRNRISEGIAIMIGTRY